MKSESEVEAILAVSIKEIESILANRGVTLTQFPRHGIGVQHVQYHKSGDQSVRAVEILLNAPF
jgi:hypothetical protein